MITSEVVRKSLLLLSISHFCIGKTPALHILISQALGYLKIISVP